jgi:hypothetical protein
MDPIDEICRDHDIEYSNIGVSAYLTAPEADKKFIERMSKQKGFWPRVYETAMRIKHKLDPFGPTDNTSVISQMVKRNGQQILRPGLPKKPKPSPKASGRQKVMAPAAVSYVSMGYNDPAAKRTLTNRENVVSTIDLSRVTPVFVNPADLTTFPMLGQEAKRYQRYTYIELSLSFEPAVGTTTAGEMIIAWVTDNNQHLPDTAEELLGLPERIVTPVWREATLTVPREKLNLGRGHYLTSQGAVGYGAESFSPGYFAYYTDCASDPGRLVMNYKVKLMGRTTVPIGPDSEIYNGSAINGTWAIAGGTIPQTTTNGAYYVLATTWQSKTPYLDPITLAVGSSLQVHRPGVFKVYVHAECTEGGVGAENIWTRLIYSTDGTNWLPAASYSDNTYSTYDTVANAATNTVGGMAVYYLNPTTAKYINFDIGSATGNVAVGHVMVAIEPMAVS